MREVDYKGGGLLESMDYEGGGLLEVWTMRAVDY